MSTPTTTTWTPATMGRKGGSAKGPSKVRGDAEYYRKMVEAREKKKAEKAIRQNLSGQRKG